MIRRKLGCFADYGAVYAREGRHLVGQIAVFRIPYAFDDGPGTMAGIAAVSTRPDRARSGVARALLEGVHRREVEAGIEYASLWTNRSWGAHALYEKLGYRDVYLPPTAVEVAPHPVRSTESHIVVRAARRADLVAIDQLHSELSAARRGFFRRPEGLTPVSVQVHFADPKANFRLAWNGRSLVGYAYFSEESTQVTCGELIARTSRARDALVSAFRIRARRRALVFQNSPVTDSPAVFRPPAFAIVPSAWYRFMGARIGRPWSRREAVRKFATHDRRFLCLEGDRF